MWLAAVCLLCLRRHSRYYVPFLTMSSDIRRVSGFARQIQSYEVAIAEVTTPRGAVCLSNGSLTQTRIRGVDLSGGSKDCDNPFGLSYLRPHQQIIMTATSLISVRDKEPL